MMFTFQKSSEAMLVFGLFLFVSYLTPFHFFPYLNFANDALAVLGVILGLGVWAWRSQERLRIPSAVIVPLGLIIVIGLQTNSGMVLFPIDSVYPILCLASFSLAIIFGASVLVGTEDLEPVCVNLAWVFVAASLLSVLFQHVQLINLNWYPFVMPLSHDQAPRPYANMAQSNLMALLHCLSLASVWWLYLNSRIKPWLGTFVTVLILLGLALTQSRIGWIIFPFYLALCWRERTGHPKVFKSVLVILFLMYAAMVMFLPVFWAALGIPMETYSQHAGQTGVRVTLWRQAFLMSTLRPWFGVGWFQFGNQQVLLSPLFQPTEYSHYAHNIVLNLAAEIGWPLTLIICLVTSHWAYVCCVKRWANIHIQFLSLLLLAIFMHSLVEYPLWNGFILMPFGVIIGALHSKKAGWRYSGVRRGWLVSFCFACALMLGGMSWDYYRIAAAFHAFFSAPATSNTVVQNLEKPAYSLVPQFYDYFDMMKIKVYPGMPKQDIQFLEKISLRFAYLPVLQNLALAYAYNQRPREALAVLQIIYSLQARFYSTTYNQWLSFAQQDPTNFSEIVKRLPKPDPSKASEELSREALE